jgi:hypothetical protein
VEEIAMKKPWLIYSQSLMHALRLLRPGLDSLSLMARGPQRRSRTIRKSTRPIMETVWTVEIVNTVASNPPNRRRIGHSSVLPMHRSGVIFITL